MTSEPSPYQLLPPLSDAEYAALKADIRERGILVPVELDEHLNILDGHHRVRIWHELKAEGVRVPDYMRHIRPGLSEAEKHARVLALNLYRRHLASEQRVEHVARIRATTGWSNERIAALAGVDGETVRRDLIAGSAYAEPAADSRVTGKDGKSYPARKPRKKPTVVVTDTAAGERRAGEALAMTPSEALPQGLLDVGKVAAAARPYRPPAERRRPLLDHPDVPLPTLFLGVGDARALELPDSSIHLVVTSPPYALDVEYDGGDVAPAAWPAFMEAWLREAVRVAVPSGRLALNVPLDTTKPWSRATHAHAVAAAERAGWTYRFSIIWQDGQVSKSIARGSVDSASAPHVIARCETIPVFSKGEWRRVSDWPSDLTHAEWLAWTDGIWVVPPETRSYDGHPAAFPEEIPHRLIKLLSFPGDRVLDPFMGSGTTAVAAIKLARGIYGCDISSEYAVSARLRAHALLSELGGYPAPWGT